MHITTRSASVVTSRTRCGLGILWVNAIIIFVWITEPKTVHACAHVCTRLQPLTGTQQRRNEEDCLSDHRHRAGSVQRPPGLLPHRLLLLWRGADQRALRGVEQSGAERRTSLLFDSSEVCRELLAEMRAA